MTLLGAHQWWAWVVVVSNAAVGLWALAAHRWPVARGRSLWWCTGAAEATVAVQIVLGAAVQARAGIEPPEYHVFYGFVALIAVALIYSYRHQLKDHLYLLYGFGGLFVMGLALRAMQLS